MAKRRRVAYKGRGHGVPSLICTATSKATGERCRKYAIVGGTVCNMHGVTGAVQDAADRRVTYAQLAGDDRRPTPEVLLDMVHKADVLTRLCEADLLAANAGTIPVDNRAGLVDLIRTTHGLAERTITSRAYEEAAFAFTRHLEMEGQLVATAVGIAIDKLDLTEPWRRYALELAHWTLLGEGDTSRGDEPQPPAEPIVREYDVGPRNTAPAIAAGPTASVPCDVAGLDDDALRDLGGRVLDELERRGVDG